MLTNVWSYVGSPELWLRSGWHLGWEMPVWYQQLWLLWCCDPWAVLLSIVTSVATEAPSLHQAQTSIKMLNQVFYFLDQLKAHYLENYKPSCVLPYDSNLTVFDGLGYSEQSFCLKEWSRFSSVCCLLCWSVLCSVGLLQNLWFNGNLTKSLLLVRN